MGEEEAFDKIQHPLMRKKYSTKLGLEEKCLMLNGERLKALP